MKGHQLPASPALAEVVRLAEVFRALAEPTRLRLVLRLSHGESNVAGLVAALDLPQSTVSRHLAVLRAADLVRGERRGTSMVYDLAGAHLRDLLLEAFSHAEHEREDATASPPPDREHAPGVERVRAAEGAADGLR